MQKTLSFQKRVAPPPTPPKAKRTCKKNLTLKISPPPPDTPSINTVSNNLYFGDKSPEKLKNDKDFVLAVVNNFGLALQYASDEVKANPKVVLAAVNNFGLALKYASDKMKANPKIVMAAISYLSSPWKDASKALKADRDFVLAALRKNVTVWKYVSETFKNDRNFVLAALLENSNLWGSVSETFKNDRDFVLAALRVNSDVWAYVSETFKNDRDFVLAALRVNSDVWAYVSNDGKFTVTYLDKQELFGLHRFLDEKYKLSPFLIPDKHRSDVFKEILIDISKDILSEKEKIELFQAFNNLTKANTIAHAIYYRFDNDKLTVYNSGEEVENHHGLENNSTIPPSKKYITAQEYILRGEKEQIDELIDNLGQNQTTKEFYTHLNNAIKMAPRPDDDSPQWQSAQKARNCSVEVLCAFLKDWCIKNSEEAYKGVIKYKQMIIKWLKNVIVNEEAFLTNNLERCKPPPTEAIENQTLRIAELKEKLEKKEIALKKLQN
jgi:hypothetical protein